MAAERPRASVIIPCLDQLWFTGQCLAALVRHTRPPWELIVVDNGSSDGTPDYLRGVQDAASVPVEVITNPRNRGFPAACNQALAVARGDFLVLLNNDAVVTDDWLKQLVALADSSPTIGLTGPMSNYAAPPQLVEEAAYADLEAMHRFAARWRAEHRGQWFTAPKLSGFCLLMKRAVFEAIGGLDEEAEIGEAEIGAVSVWEAEIGVASGRKSVSLLGGNRCRFRLCGNRCGGGNRCPAAHNAVGLAGESPAVGIDCLPT
jgi:GT2 family glycosyltransferase